MNEYSKLESATMPNAGAVEVKTKEKHSDEESQSESPTKCEIKFITKDGKKTLWVSKGCIDGDSFLEALNKVEDNEVIDFDTIEFEGGGEVDLGLPPILEDEEISRVEQLKVRKT